MDPGPGDDAATLSLLFAVSPRQAVLSDGVSRSVLLIVRFIESQ